MVTSNTVQTCIRNNTTPGITYTNKATTIYTSTQGVWLTLYSNTNVSWEVFLLRKSAPVVEEGEKKMKALLILVYIHTYCNVHTLLCVCIVRSV